MIGKCLKSQGQMGLVQLIASQLASVRFGDGSSGSVGLGLERAAARAQLAREQAPPHLDRARGLRAPVGGGTPPTSSCRPVFPTPYRVFGDVRLLAEKNRTSPAATGVGGVA